MALDHTESSSEFKKRAEFILTYLQSPSSVDKELFTLTDWMAMRIAFTHSPNLSEEIRETIRKQSAPFLAQSIRTLREQPKTTKDPTAQPLKTFIDKFIQIYHLSRSLTDFQTNQEDIRIDDQELKKWFESLQDYLPQLEKKTRMELYLALSYMRTLHPKWLKLPSVSAIEFPKPTEELEEQSLSEQPDSDSISKLLPFSVLMIVDKVDNQLQGKEPMKGLASIVAILSETPVVTKEEDKKELLAQATDYTQYLRESIEALHSPEIKSHTQRLLHRLKSEHELLKELGALYQSTLIWQQKNKSLTDCLMFPPDDPDYLAFRHSYQQLVTWVQTKAQQTRMKPNIRIPDPLSIVYYYPFDQLQQNHLLDREVVEFLTFANPSLDATTKEKVFWVVQSLFPPVEDKKTPPTQSKKHIAWIQRLFRRSKQDQDKDEELYNAVMRQLSFNYINKGQPLSTYSEEDRNYLQNTLFPYILQKARDRGWKTSYPLLHGLVREKIEVDVPEEWQKIDMRTKCGKLAEKIIKQIQTQSVLPHAEENNLVEKAKKIDPQSDPSILVDENISEWVFRSIKETKKLFRIFRSRGAIPTFAIKVPKEAETFSKSEHFTREVQDLILHTLHKNSEDYLPQEAFIAATSSLQKPVAKQKQNDHDLVAHYLNELEKKVERVQSSPNYPEENLAFELATTRVAIETIRQNAHLSQFDKSNQPPLTSPLIPKPQPQIQGLLSSVKALGEWCKRESRAWEKSLMPTNEFSREIE